MAKKSKKNITEQTGKIEASSNLSTGFIRTEENNSSITTTTSEEFLAKYGISEITYITKKPIELLDITQLISLEKACSLLCKRFETTAQLDIRNNAKFKEFKNYYEMIFSELEKRVLDICKE